MELHKTVTDAEEFLRELTRLSAGKPVEIHVHLTERKEDALADVRLALDMSYGGGTSMARVLTER
jgi:hypothetical protein